LLLAASHKLAASDCPPPIFSASSAACIAITSLKTADDTGFIDRPAWSSHTHTGVVGERLSDWTAAVS
jgi:hypothetical protein